MGTLEEERVSAMVKDLLPALKPTEDADSDDDLTSSDVLDGLAATLGGRGGEIMVLFETPSGFAIFNYDGVKLIVPDAIKKVWSDFFNGYVANKAVWLEQFKTFKDKGDVISEACIDVELAEMIQKHVRAGQKLAVAKQEYADVIQKCLNIECLCNKAVEELMWGLTYQLGYFLPEEELKLATKGFYPICQGMKYVLETLNIHVKPEMVNKRIIEVASVVYESNRCLNKHYKSLHSAGRHLETVSNIDCKSWDLLKLATALKLICYPDEAIEDGNPQELFSEVERARLEEDAPKYKGLIYKVAILGVYNKILWVNKLQSKALGVLVDLVKQANDEYDEAQAMTSHGSKDDIQPLCKVNQANPKCAAKPLSLRAATADCLLH